MVFEGCLHLQGNTETNSGDWTVSAIGSGTEIGTETEIETFETETCGTGTWEKGIYEIVKYEIYETGICETGTEIFAIGIEIAIAPCIEKGNIKINNAYLRVYLIILRNNIIYLKNIKY